MTVLATIDPEIFNQKKKNKKKKTRYDENSMSVTLTLRSCHPTGMAVIKTLDLYLPSCQI